MVSLVDIDLNRDLSTFTAPDDFRLLSIDTTRANSNICLGQYLLSHERSGDGHSCHFYENTVHDQFFLNSLPKVAYKPEESFL